MTYSRKIKTKTQYKHALQRLSDIFQAKPGTKDGEEAELLELLIKDYEDKNFVFEAPNPLEAIRYRMEQEGLTNKDLAKILGYKSRITDLFNKHRKLNLNMVRSLYYHWNIPLESLIKKY
jgi:HTH-type transcriptional regulator / antitoxin HigA